MLETESITSLRGIAQAQNVAWSLSDTRDALIQKIEQKIGRKIGETLPPVVPMVPNMTMDPRLLTTKPAKISNPDMIKGMLAEAIGRGLILTFPSVDTWHMRWVNKEDSGTLRQEPRNIVLAANKLMGTIK